MKPCTQSSIRHWEDHPCLLPFSSYTAAKLKYTTQLGAIRITMHQTGNQSDEPCVEDHPSHILHSTAHDESELCGHASTLPLAQCPLPNVSTCNETLPTMPLDHAALQTLHALINALNMPLDQIELLISNTQHSRKQIRSTFCCPFLLTLLQAEITSTAGCNQNHNAVIRKRTTC